MKKIILFSNPILAKIDGTKYGYHLVYGNIPEDWTWSFCGEEETNKHLLNWVKYLVGREAIALCGGEVTATGNSHTLKDELWTIDDQTHPYESEEIQEFCANHWRLKNMTFQIVEINDEQICKKDIYQGFLLDRKKWLELLPSGCRIPGCDMPQVVF